MKKLQQERVAVEEAEGRAVESDGTGTAPGVSEIAPGFAYLAHCLPLWDASYDCCELLHGHRVRDAQASFSVDTLARQRQSSQEHASCHSNLLQSMVLVNVLL